MAITPEYQQMIEEMMSRYGKLKSQAEASGIGEAQRRGLINQAGTSDLEFAIRKSKVDPYASAEAQGIAGLLGRGAETEAAQRYGTSEREASQKYGTAERLGSQEFQGGQSQTQRDWQAQQEAYNRDLQKYLGQQQNALQQQQLGIMNNANDYRQSNWKTGLGLGTSLLGGLAGGLGGSLGKKLFG